MARRTKLFTIGYEQTPPKAVHDELEQAGVKLVVDVRAVTSSRRPGFSKKQLSAGLEQMGHLLIDAGNGAVFSLDRLASCRLGRTGRCSS